MPLAFTTISNKLDTCIHTIVPDIGNQNWMFNLSNEEGKDQESIQSSTTPDPGSLNARFDCQSTVKFQMV